MNGGFFSDGPGQIYSRSYSSPPSPRCSINKRFVDIGQLVEDKKIDKPNKFFHVANNIENKSATDFADKDAFEINDLSSSTKNGYQRLDYYVQRRDQMLREYGEFFNLLRDATQYFPLSKKLSILLDIKEAYKKPFFRKEESLESRRLLTDLTSHWSCYFNENKLDSDTVKIYRCGMRFREDSKKAKAIRVSVSRTWKKLLEYCGKKEHFSDPFFTAIKKVILRQSKPEEVGSHFFQWTAGRKNTKEKFQTVGMFTVVSIASFMLYPLLSLPGYIKDKVRRKTLPVLKVYKLVYELYQCADSPKITNAMFATFGAQIVAIYKRKKEEQLVSSSSKSSEKFIRYSDFSDKRMGYQWIAKYLLASREDQNNFEALDGSSPLSNNGKTLFLIMCEQIHSMWRQHTMPPMQGMMEGVLLPQSPNCAISRSFARNPLYDKNVLTIVSSFLP